MKSLTMMRVVRSALAGAWVALALGSCGKAADEDDLQIDSNTNWLMRCDSDTECSGSLRCFCGQCSQPCSQSDECQLLAGAECASSGGAVCTDQPSAGGLCVLGCSEDDECGPDFSCTDAQCVPRPCTGTECAPTICTGGYQSWDDVYELIAADTARLDVDDATYTRYVSLANRWSYGACGPTLNAERQGLSKLLNSLSLATPVTSPSQIDADATLYRIDLRDYDWDRPLSVAGVAYADVWDVLTANNPFAVPFAGEDVDDIVADTGALIPMMFANSLIATATRPDLYAAILGLPDSYDQLLSDLGVDVTAPAQRAGVSGSPEIIATHRPLGVRTGYSWELAVVNGLQGTLFGDPLQTPSGERQILFSLANGLQGFMYVDAEGRRIDDSDVFIDTSENNFRATVPRTPLRQHSPKPNIYDVVRDNLTNNPGLYAPEVEPAVIAAYPGRQVIAALIDSQYETFTRPALEAASVNVIGAEPITAAIAEYDRDMVIEDVAGELLVTREDLEDNLALLDPAFGALQGGVMDRDDVAALFREALCTLSAVNENQPRLIECQ